MVPEIRKVGHDSLLAEREGYPWQPCERQPPGTVTLLEQWKQRYLPNTYQAKREGRAGNKLSETIP